MTDLEGRDEIGSLKKSQLADLVDNSGNLGVGGSCCCGGSIGGLPSPPHLILACGGTDGFGVEGESPCGALA